MKEPGAETTEARNRGPGKRAADLLLRVLREAKRRKVYTTTVAYVAISIALIEFGGAIFEAVLLPEWSSRLLTILLVLGFPVVVMLAWMFDVGPEGMTRTALAAEPQAAGGPDQAAVAPPLRGAGRAGAGGAATSGARGKRLTLPSRSPLSRRRTAPVVEPPPLAPPEPPAAEPESAAPPDPERVRQATLAHVRHELRTPINAIVGYSEMLLEDCDEDEEAEAALDLERIRRAGRELMASVDKILDPQHAPDSADADLETLGARIRADLRDPTTAVIGYAEMLIEGDHPAMRADLERILGAARSLLDMSGDIVRIATLPDGSAAEAGMLDAATIAHDVLAKIRPLEATDSDDDARGSLLVVDDNAFNRDLLSRQLARKGYMVATVESGREALERLASEAYDLILLDIMMPGMDGVEVLRRLKASPRLAEVPVIMISSLNEIDGAIRCLEMGAADYLMKPFHPTLLGARIGAVLENRRMRAKEALYRQQVESEDESLRRIVLSVCPASVSERLSGGEEAFVDVYTHAAVLACDLASGLSSEALLDPALRGEELTRRLHAIERAAEDQGLDCVLVLGSWVLVFTGEAADPDDAVARLAEVALAASGEIGSDGAAAGVGGHVPRMGLHGGPAFATVLSGQRMSYHVWGEAVDLARMLADSASAGSIHLSPAVHARLRDRYATEKLGVMELGGKGQMRTYRLEGHLG